MNALIQLENIIERLKDELHKYAVRSEANEFYLRKQNELIAELVNIYNSLDELKYPELWTELEKAIIRLEQLDPEISKHCITIKTKMKGNNSSFININPFT